ncbi:Predicted DNA-binding transcriptional regulator YafY, contains an HTH and WYL domains [Flavobacterium fryxellicola]|uniref:WYL domain-containing protein n=1 Tax=Flavobacterium fryxellicola TaxID=249352 RepID=A0A167ZKY7_9FLAO|nr:WYL domain-containing protein [Flavobacterium fryxellicola]OAB30561.1 WYL domain-containing protein [Flavobacterium fryxellicola]SHN77014.1 Predicted DNA-binding transcriptional regulator YafY, contains an HTH and WYL domains [Flavobacterium fryxellicola]
MAVTKKPLIRYKILDACFKNPYKNFTKELLLDAVNDKLLDLFDDETQCVKLRQLQDDIAFMKSAEGWGIELADIKDGKKRIYRYEDLDYSINNAPLNEVEMDQFQSAIQVLSQFEGMPQFEGIQEIIAKLKTDLKVSTNEKPFIGFDRSQDLKGIEYFSTLYNAVQNKTTLEITYKDFKTEEPYTYIFHPHYLKEYNNRWFLFGFHPESYKWDWNVAIDRIVSVRPIVIPFVVNETIDWQEYFSDMIGVSKGVNAVLENVELHFNQLTGKYMENKSIHETQKHKWLDEFTLELKIKVMPNYELERLILSYGESVKVIEPQHLKDRIKERLLKGLDNY